MWCLAAERLLLKQVIHRNGGIDFTRMHILFQTISGDKNGVDGIARSGVVHKCGITATQVRGIVTCEDELGLAVFHLAHVNDMIPPAQQKVYLSARPFRAVFINQACCRPRTDVSQHAFDTQLRPDLLNMMQAHLLKGIARPCLARSILDIAPEMFIKAFSFAYKLNEIEAVQISELIEVTLFLLAVG